MTEQLSKEGTKPPPIPRDDFYENQIRFFGQSKIDGRAIQRSLEKMQVMIVGAGAVGSHAADSLSQSGVGHLHLLDAVKTTEQDIPANAFFTQHDIGKTRAEALAAHVAARNPNVSCKSATADALSSEKLGNAIRGLDAVMVCADSASPSLMDVVNEAALRTNKRLLVGQVAQGVGLVGPTVIPRQSACYKCYELRRNANLLNYEEIMKYESRLREMPGIRSELVAPRPFAALVGGLLALEALRLLSGLVQPQTVGRILRVNFNAPEMTYHRLLRLPNCPACGYEKRRPLPQLPSGK